MLLTVVSFISSWLNPLSEPGLIIMNIFASPTVSCIIGSLLMFRLKEAARKGTNSGISKPTNPRTTSAMIFN